MTVIVISFWKRNSKDLNGVLKRRKIMDNFFNLSDSQKKKSFYLSRAIVRDVLFEMS